jgi:hypothetical protein
MFMNISEDSTMECDTNFSEEPASPFFSQRNSLASVCSEDAESKLL